jgi:uncharacterized protein (TIGR03437 family)
MFLANRWQTILTLTLLWAPTVAAQSANWTPRQSLAPAARLGQAMAYDSVHSQTVLFGGVTIDSWPTDTWLWNGSAWTEALPQSAPPARIYAGLAFDSVQGQTVLFSGMAANGNYFNDTWLWSGANWTQASPQTNPTARVLFGMAYDSAHSQVVLFGGSDFYGRNLNDTWAWNGTNWIQQSPQTSPPARYGHYMTFDSVRGQVVMFGGIDANDEALADTWIWDGANWSQALPPSSPSARAVGAMVFDTKQGQAVLFAGADQELNALDDTWLWNGTNWTQQSPQASPSARYEQGMAFDSVNNVTVLFGGGDQAGDFLGDTWTYGLPAVVTPPTVVGPAINLVLSASAYGAFTSVAPGSWIEIYGTDLAPETTGWSATDFTGNNAPIMLDNVSVSIAGQAAFVDYISPTQVNVQLPSEIAAGGPLQLTVTNGTQTSAPVNVTVNTTEAGLLAPASFKVGANQYVVAQHLDGTSVLPTGAIPFVTSSPAQPGETIVIYGVGFGSVVPNIPAGQIVTESNQLSASLQILFGKTSAKIVLLRAGTVRGRRISIRYCGSGRREQRSGAALFQSQRHTQHADAIYGSTPVVVFTAAVFTAAFTSSIIS